MKNGGGTEAFEAYYAGIHGPRWPSLKAALLAERRGEAYVGKPLMERLPDSPAKRQAASRSTALKQPYHMDTASRMAGEWLAGRRPKKVLDMCAAPGGKTLVLLQQDSLESLVANEPSTPRRFRLGKVLADHVPEVLRQRVKVTPYPGKSPALRRLGPFDGILVDAPCSSERHVLAQPKLATAWKESRVKRLAKQQLDLLIAATSLLESGGTLLYATCAVNPVENQRVVERLLKKRSDYLEPVPVELPLGRAASPGWEVFPDYCGGAGPLFLAGFVKK